ncbi:MAG: nucleotidyltransferase family protein [Kiritimatiellae bacterium]|nr:nucleotidyltransferase family protein [Kiritimatiellia bacterium]
MKTTQELISEGLAERGVSVLLIGGMALPAFDVVRQTVDIDCLMVSGEESILHDVLAAAGYVETAKTENFVRYSSPSIYHADVDLLLVDTATFDSLFAESQPLNIGNVLFNVPCLAHMIMLKLHAMKNSSKRELKDLSDIVAILQNKPSCIDDNDLHELCDRYGPDGIYNRLMEAL